jgi:hypothetical protein
MTIRRGSIRSVLHNFLGTYTSRYSDYEGYWLFGMLVAEVGEMHVDLLIPSGGTTEPGPAAAAVRLAAKKFGEQMQKAGSAVSCVREACLDITRLPASQNGVVNGRIRAGYTVRFLARVVSDSGKTYESEISVFVAPHDARIEHRSARGT